MPMKIIRNDITKMKVDAIVNAANTRLKMGGGVCGAIFSAAGARELQGECDQIGRCNVGQAVITKAYKLPAKYVIHAVGPVWDGGNAGEAKLLKDCYTNSLKLALERGCESLAFPLISSGIYGYPKDQAIQIAISAISAFLVNHDIMVYLVVYDRKSFVLSEKLFTAIERYIDDNYIEEHPEFLRRNYNQFRESSRYFSEEFVEVSECKAMPAESPMLSLDEIMVQLDESFSQMLLRLIDERGMTDVEAYKRANIDRRLFSKIRSDKDYNPSKQTAIALAVSLRLPLEETRELLSRAGYALSPSNKFDVIIRYFIEAGNYNIYEINEALFAFNQDTLGA